MPSTVPPEHPTQAEIAAAFARLGMNTNTPYRTMPDFGRFDTDYHALLVTRHLDGPRNLLSPQDLRRLEVMEFAYDVVQNASNDAIHAGSQPSQWQANRRRIFTVGAIGLGFGLAAAVVTGIAGGTFGLAAAAGVAAAAVSAAGAGYIMAPDKGLSALQHTKNVIPHPIASLFGVAAGLTAACYVSGGVGKQAVVGILAGFLAYGFGRALRAAPFVTIGFSTLAVVGVAGLSQCQSVRSTAGHSPILSGVLDTGSDISDAGGKILQGFRACTTLATTKQDMKGSSCTAVIKNDAVEEGDKDGSPDSGNKQTIVKGTQVTNYGIIAADSHKLQIGDPNQPGNVAYVRLKDVALIK